MNADLEEQLNELGSEYRAVVSRLRAAREIDARSAGGRRAAWRSAGWLVAATLLLILGLSVVFRTSQPSQTFQTSAPREYCLSPDEMIATQNPDGSWQNDFLTRRNAKALAGCEGVAARIAYKKAMRNLRSKGIL